MLDNKPVLSKRDFCNRFKTGEFGNRGPNWWSLDEFKLSLNTEGLFHLRNRVPGGTTYYDLQYGQLIELWQTMPNRDIFYAAAMAPTANTIIQGEVMEGPWGLNLTWTTIRKPMREALQHLSNFNTGLLAKYLLQKSMNDLSWQWLQHLLESYPDHVIEFSVYEHCWGTVSGYNTVFWEIRKY
jgi:hypothetical protein